jgi:tetrahydromethanopterin S-methyltransferase subunit B
VPSIAAVAGFVSATTFGILAGVCLGAAVALLGRVEPEAAAVR